MLHADNIPHTHHAVFVLYVQVDVPAAGGPVAEVVPHGSVEAVCDLLVLGGEVDGRVGEGGDDFLGGREPPPRLAPVIKATLRNTLVPHSSLFYKE